MIYIAYCSAAVQLMDSVALVDLLKVARANNARDGITGMLLYRDGSFMQVLEGETTSVQRAYQKILGDLRHRNVIKLAQGEISERSFADWSMGFRDIGSLTGDELDAFSTFLIEPFDSSQYAGGSKALKLLRSFRQIAQ